MLIRNFNKPNLKLTCVSETKRIFWILWVIFLRVLHVGFEALLRNFLCCTSAEHIEVVSLKWCYTNAQISRIVVGLYHRHVVLNAYLAHFVADHHTVT